jgi:hypothetical protein
VCLFPLAHHDRLQLTQQWVVWNRPPQGGSGGPASIVRTAPGHEALPTSSSLPVRDTHIHRSRLTFDYVEVETGRLERGRIASADREHLAGWLSRFDGDGPVAFALEGCTGWRYVVEEMRKAGVAPHLAEPADTAALRGPKRRAKTDEADAKHLGELLGAGRLPECYIPPEQVLEWRATLQLYSDLRVEHTGWAQRIHATCQHRANVHRDGDLAHSWLLVIRVPPTAPRPPTASLTQPRYARLLTQLVGPRSTAAIRSGPETGPRPEPSRTRPPRRSGAVDTRPNADKRMHARSMQALRGIDRALFLASRDHFAHHTVGGVFAGRARCPPTAATRAWARQAV